MKCRNELTEDRIRNCPMSNPHHNRAVFSDPISENETVLKLSSWMWMSGRKRMRRNAREATQRKADRVRLAASGRGQEGQRNLSGDGGRRGRGFTPGSGDTALGDLSAKLD